jgi:hypothetical protein
MLGKFWESLGSGLADQFLGRLLTPALLFWAVGAAAWASAGAGLGAVTRGLPPSAVAAAFTAAPGPLQLSALVVSLFVLVASAVVAERLTLPLLRLLEGYYWPRGLASCLRGRVQAERERVRVRATELAKELRTGNVSSEGAEQLRTGNVSAEHAVKLATLEESLRRWPAAPQLTMPTRLGNILRAAEERPGTHYGLDATVCWPALWLLLDESMRTEVASARTSLNASVTLWLWAVASLVWTIFAWWVPPLAVASALVVYYVAILSSAEVYGDLMNSVFAVRRTLLYEALRWPLPETPAAEPECGRALTMYLWRGLAPPDAAFLDNPKSQQPG